METEKTVEFEFEDGIEPPKSRGRSGNSKYPFGKMPVGKSYKIVFTSQDPEEQKKELKAAWGSLIGYKSKNRSHQFKTWTVTKEQSIENKEKHQGPGLWVKRLSDFTEEQVAQREAKREKARTEKTTKTPATE